MDAQRQSESVAADKKARTEQAGDYSSIYTGTGEPHWVTNLKERTNYQQQPQPQTQTYDPQTGYVGIPRENIPTYLGGEQEVETQTQQVSPRASSQLKQFLAEQTAKETDKVMGTETGGERTDFWGSPIQQHAAQTEQKMQVDLAELHITNTESKIRSLQGEIGELGAIMDTERARISSEEGSSMSSYSEAMLINSSALYKESKFRKENLQKELAESIRYLEAETV